MWFQLLRESSNRKILAHCRRSPRNLLCARNGLHLQHAVMHARHPPAPFGLLAHGHAAPVQHSAYGFKREFIFVPDRFADGVKRALPNLQPRRRLLMKIAVAKVPKGLLASVKLAIRTEEYDFWVQALPKALLFTFFYRSQATVHLALHLRRHRFAVVLPRLVT